MLNMENIQFPGLCVNKINGKWSEFLKNNYKLFTKYKLSKLLLFH